MHLWCQQIMAFICPQRLKYDLCYREERKNKDMIKSFRRPNGDVRLNERLHHKILLHFLEQQINIYRIRWTTLRWRPTRQEIHLWCRQIMTFICPQRLEYDLCYMEERKNKDIIKSFRSPNGDVRLNERLHHKILLNFLEQQINM